MRRASALIRADELPEYIHEVQTSFLDNCCDAVLVPAVEGRRCEAPAAVARHLIRLFTGDPASLADKKDGSRLVTRAAALIGVFAALAGIVALSGSVAKSARTRRSLC